MRPRGRRVVGGASVLIDRHPPYPATCMVRQASRDQENCMLDIIMLALGLGFFAAAVGYTYACERL